MVTTLSIDKELIAQAKAKGMNISAFAERELRKALKPSHSDLDDSNILFKCPRCKKVVDFIYMCSHSNELLCYDCEIKDVCVHGLKETAEPDGLKFHEHHRIPALDVTKTRAGELELAKKEQYRTGVKDLI